MLDQISKIIESIYEAGWSQIIYNVFFFGGFVGLTAYNLGVSKKYGITKIKAIVFTVAVYLASVAWMFVLYRIFTGVWGGNNIVRVFAWVPLIAFPVAKLLKIDYLTSIDFISPCLCINHGIAHLGCIFAGCCYGHPMEHGVFSANTFDRRFPIQPIEALIALGIAVFIAMREKKKGYKTDGLSFPIMLMLFGYSRFFLEFARDNDKMFWGVSELALHALFAGVVGTVLYFVIKSYNKKKAARAIPA